MTKKLFLNCILTLCLILFGCSHTNPETTAFDILKVSYDKMNSLESFKIKYISNGTVFDLYESVKQLPANYTSVSYTKRKDSRIYTLSITYRDDYTYFRIKYEDESISHNIEGITDDELENYYYDYYSNYENESGLMFFSLDSLSYYRPAYEYTYEKKDEGYIVTSEIANSDKMLDLITETMLESDPDYDPFVTFYGTQLPKREYKQSTEYHINKQGYITYFKDDINDDYGIGYDDYVYEGEYSDFNEISLDTNKLDELLEGILSGDIGQYSDITEYIVWE